MSANMEFERRKNLADNNIQRYLNDIKNNKPLSLEEEVELGRRIKQGDLLARDELVTANLRFAASVVFEYRNKGIPLGDLIAAGNDGLIMAAGKFDGDKGFKFISYAVWWIRQRILQVFAEEKRTVRLPINKVDLMRNIYRFENDKLNRTGRNPTEEEIAKELNQSVKLIRETLTAGQAEVSIDANVGDDDERTFHELFSDPRQESPEELCRKTLIKSNLEKALKSLNDEREAEILRMYFGLGDYHEMNLREIGTRIGLTRERVRQIKEKALRKLRRPSRVVFLEDRSREYRELFLSAVRR